jgi:hypothetical protein
MDQNMGWIIAAIGLMGTFLGWYTKVTISTALGEFKDGLRKEFGERFLDATLAAAKLEPMQRDIAQLHERINSVEDYAHTRTHDLANKIQECELRFGLTREKT